MAYDITQDFMDPLVSQKGVEVEFFGGAILIIASDENPKYKAEVSRSAQGNKVRLETTNEETVELVKKITCDAMARHILLGWRGIVDADGAEVPYSREQAFDYLMRSSRLRDFVQAEAGKSSNFHALKADDVGKPSLGALSGVPSLES